MIEVKNFTKIYKLSRRQMAANKSKSKAMTAVDDISFTAQPGQIFGLLGPNGAGKTTTLRTIATLLKPTQGQVTVGGFDVVEDSEQVRKTIGFLTNELKLEKHFTPAYTMNFFGKLYGMDEATISARRERLFDQFGITEFQHKKISELSTGMSQKLSIAVSLVHDPEVVIFDEPTNGLDIITAKAVTDYLKQLKAEGKLVIISTHIMTVAEQLCDHIAIIIGGEKVADGSVADILAQAQADSLEAAFFELYKNHTKEVV